LEGCKVFVGVLPELVEDTQLGLDRAVNAPLSGPPNESGLKLDRCERDLE
jgi:hypothetical protein